MLVGFMSRTGQLPTIENFDSFLLLSVQSLMCLIDAEQHEMKDINCFDCSIVGLIKIKFILLIFATVNCQWHSLVAKISHLHYLK